MLRSLMNVSLPLVRRHLGQSCIFAMRPVRLRFVHTSSVCHKRKFVSGENNMSYEFLVRDPKYHATMAPLSDDFHRPKEPLSSDQFTMMLTNNKWSIENILDDFVRISYFIRDQDMETAISESCFDDMVLKLMEASTIYDYDSICKVLFCLRLWPPVEKTVSNNFKELWNHLDRLCEAKSIEWERPQLLIMCDHWFRLNLLRIAVSGKPAMKRCIRRMNSSSTPQIVQTLFYINVRRFFPTTEVVNVQVNLEKVVSALNADEVGIVALAFFKCKKRIVSFNLMEMMIRKLITHAETVHYLSITSVSKAIHMGLHIGLTPLANQLFDRLHPRISTEGFSFMACVHLILAGTNVQMPHYGIINSVTARMIKNISQVRLKDMERLCMSLQMYNIPKEMPGVSDDIYQAIGEELKRPERDHEINTYARSFTSLLHFLSVPGYYDYDLSNRALSHDFLNNVYLRSVSASAFEILSLDTGLEIECPGYTGSRLSERAKRHLGKEMSQNPIYYKDFLEKMEKGSYSDKIMKQIAASFVDIIGPDWEAKMFIGHCLPNFFRPDLILKLSPDGENFEDIPDDFRNAWIGDIKRPDSSTWITVILASRASMIRNSKTQEFVGNVHFKLRLMEKLGYNTITIVSSLWPEDKVEQLNLIKSEFEKARDNLKKKIQVQAVA